MNQNINSQEKRLRKPSNILAQIEKKKKEILDTVEDAAFKKFPSKDQKKLRMFYGAYIFTLINPKAFRITQYLDAIDQDEKEYYEIIKEDRMFQKYHNMALRVIGGRREEIGIDRNLNLSHTSQYVIPRFLHEYREEQQSRNDQKKDEENKSTVINVHMKQFEEEKQ